MSLRRYRQCRPGDIYIVMAAHRAASLMLMFISALAGLTAFYLLYRHRQITAMLRPINDITTNIADPLLFVAVLP